MLFVTESVYAAIVECMNQRTLELLRDALQDLDEKVRSGELVPPTIHFKATLIATWEAYLGGLDPENMPPGLSARMRELIDEKTMQFEHFCLTNTKQTSSQLDAVTMLTLLDAFGGVNANGTPSSRPGRKLREALKAMQKAGKFTFLEFTAELFEKTLDLVGRVQISMWAGSVQDFMKSAKGKMEQLFDISDADLVMRQARLAPATAKSEATSSKSTAGKPRKAKEAASAGRGTPVAARASRSSDGATWAMMPRESDGSCWAAPRISISGSEFVPCSSALLAPRSSAGAPFVPRCSLGAPLPRLARLSVDAPRSSAGAPYMPRCSAGAPWVKGAARAAATSSRANPPAPSRGAGELGKKGPSAVHRLLSHGTHSLNTAR